MDAETSCCRSSDVPDLGERMGFVRLTEARLFEHQVGGHGCGRIRQGFLRHDGAVLKRGQEGEQGRRERELLRRVWGPPSPGSPFASFTAGLVERLREFVPRFFGPVVVLDDLDPGAGVHEHEYLRLEDATAGYRCPCVVDVKIGRVGDPFEVPEKLERARRKHPEQHDVGYRFIGVKVAGSGSADGVFGKASADKPKIEREEGFRRVFSARTAAAALPGIVDGLRRLHAFFEEQDELAVFSASVLMVFEGHDDPTCPPPLPPRVVLIDFGHAYLSEEVSGGAPSVDHNSRYGVGRLLEDMLHFAGRFGAVGQHSTCDDQQLCL